MPKLQLTTDSLAVGLFGRVSGVREFFALFREAAGHEFILDHQDVLEDWKHNCSAVRYVLEPVYWYLENPRSRTSTDNFNFGEFFVRNMVRWSKVQRPIVAAWEWLDSQTKFDLAVREELIRRFGEVNLLLRVWTDRLIRDLAASNPDWSNRLLNTANNADDQEWVCQFADTLFSSAIPATRARFRKVIAPSLLQLIDDLDDSIEECHSASISLSVISDSFDSPSMKMCMKARRLYLGTLQAILTAGAELSADVIDRIIHSFSNAENLATQSLHDLNSDRFARSLENLQRRVEVLQSCLPVARFDRLALTHT